MLIINPFQLPAFKKTIDNIVLVFIFLFYASYPNVYKLFCKHLDKKHIKRNINTNTTWHMLTILRNMNEVLRNNT